MVRQVFLRTFLYKILDKFLPGQIAGETIVGQTVVLLDSLALCCPVRGLTVVHQQ